MMQWLTILLSTGVTTAALVVFHADAIAAGMVYLVLVVWSATLAGIWLALSVALFCSVAFDFFFLPPLYTFRLAGAQEWTALIAYLLSCLIVGRVAELARRQTRQAEQRRADVERLYALSQEMMLQEDAMAMIRDLPQLIRRIFALDEVVLYVSDQDQFYSAGAELPESTQAQMRMLTQGVNPTLSGAERLTVIALTLGLRPVGALGWAPEGLSREVATAAGAQVAIALTRAAALEASARMEAAREGERLRAALIDSLTHELRTPLTSIRAAATTLLQSEGLDEISRQEMAAIVDEEASRLDALIGEAVEMAEIDANVVQVHLLPQHARELLEQAVAARGKALASHQVSLDVEEDDTPAWFDQHLLSRVFQHLLENAARFTPAGGKIVLRCRRRAGRLEFAVEDSGAGIDPADLPLIFEKFYRGKKVAGKSKGTGMGLAITRAILLAHGGGIEARSTPGKGARFDFWIPLIEKEHRTPESAG
jgi:two-component system sensor histidine kinase KdpD